MPVLTYDIDRDRRDLDVTKRIARLMPDDSGFTVILMRSRKKSTRSSEKIWYDHEPAAWWTQVSAAKLATDTVISVTDASMFYIDDVLKFTKSGEVARVTAVDKAANTITLVRGYAGSAAAALAVNDWVLRLTNAMEENSLAPTARTNQPAKRNNFVQTIRTPFDESMESEEEALETNGSERDRLRRDYLLEHRLEIERAVLFGEKKEDVTEKRRMAGGIHSFLTDNVYDAGGSLTETKLNDFTVDGMKFGRKPKLLVTSPLVANQINTFASGKIQVRSGQDTYGVQLMEYLNFRGRLLIVTSEVFENDYAGMGMLLDMSKITYYTKGGNSTTLRANIQENDRDGWKDEYLTRCTISVELSKTHALLKNAA